MDMITFPDAGSGNIKKIKKFCFEKNRCGRVRRTRNQIGVALHVAFFASNNMAELLVSVDIHAILK